MSDDLRASDLNDRTAETYEPNPHDAARAESDLAFIAKKRREIEWYQGNIFRAEEKIARAEERLKAFAIQYRQTVGGSQISLANGFVSVTKQRERTEIYDRDAWSKWVKAKPWPADYYDQSINESKVRAAFDVIDNGDFYLPGPYPDSRAERVPGIRRVKPGPIDFNVKIKAGRNIDPNVVTWDQQTTSGRTILGHQPTEETDDADAE